MKWKICTMITKRLCWKKYNKTQRNGKTSCVYGSEELIVKVSTLSKAKDNTPLNFKLYCRLQYFRQ